MVIFRQYLVRVYCVYQAVSSLSVDVNSGTGRYHRYPIKIHKVRNQDFLYLINVYPPPASL